MGERRFEGREREFVKRESVSRQSGLAHAVQSRTMADVPLLLGHRGTSALRSAGENTVRSFDLALQHGCDGFEFDVRRSKDGVGVICHGTIFHGVSIPKATASQLPRLPLLGDILARYASCAFLDIELKVSGLAQQLLSALCEHVPERGYVVSSFVPEILIELRIHSDSVPLGLICRNRKQLQRWQDLPVQYVIPYRSLITQQLVRNVRNAGKLLFAWTVNDRARMLRLADWGVDGIISDKTELLVKTLKPHSQE
jgi:glycerophosphoryl diester phosphodiesterase